MRTGSVKKCGVLETFLLNTAQQGGTVEELIKLYYYYYYYYYYQILRCLYHKSAQRHLTKYKNINYD